MVRLRSIIIIFAVLGIVLFSRIVWLQAVCADELRNARDKQSICTVELTEANRGMIFDRNNHSLTADSETASLLIIPALCNNPNDTADKLCQLFGFERKLLLRKITGNDNKNIRLKPFVALTGLTEEDISVLEKENIGGAVAVLTSERLIKSLPAQHLLGTLKINEKGEIVGASGLEKIYDKYLNGSQIRTLHFRVGERNNVETDNYFYEIKQNQIKSSVTLTVDSAIQTVAESALGDKEGAVIVLDSKNGDVLAMVASPKYDPYGLKKESDNCLVNKALTAEPPASLFKVFSAAVALDNNIVFEDTPFVCNGGTLFHNGQTVYCWKKSGHGFISFGDAVAQSCNTVLIAVAKAIGTEKLMKEFKRWELNDDRLIGYPLNQTSEIKKAENDVALANIALGEDGVQLTPLNAAKMMNVIASGGYVMTPRIVTEVRDKKGRLKDSFEEALPVRVISAKTASVMTGILKKTFISGTCSSLGLQDANIAGKTGSSETGNVWLGGFFPADNPRYTVVVTVKNGSGGAVDARPIFKKIFLILNNGNN